MTVEFDAVACGPWEVCFSSPVDAEAHIVRGYLEHYGVPCHIGSRRFGMEPITFGALGQVEVLVPHEWCDVARGLIRGRLGASAPTVARK